MTQAVVAITLEYSITKISPIESCCAMEQVDFANYRFDDASLPLQIDFTGLAFIV